MIIDKSLLNNLSAQAKASPRLRMHYDLRDSDNDSSQRMLNALEPGTVMEIHQHPNTSETIVVLRGAIIEHFYNDEAQLTESHILKAGGEVMGVSVPIGQLHNLECLEEGTVILSIKNGTYQL